MSRITVALLALALVAGAQAPAMAAARSAAVARAPRAAAAAKPSAKRPVKPSSPAPAPGVPRPVATEPPANPQQSCPTPQQGVTSRVTSVPWAQQALNFSSAWRFARGQNVTVAVVDSGVDYSPQLTGKVTAVDLTKTGFQDCVGHGTAIAGLIAATDMQARGVPFVGVAPAAKILSVKVQSGEVGSPSAGSSVLAQGIVDAAALGARVINVSITTSVSSPQLSAAVRYALSRNVVIVAAGGNDSNQTGFGPFYPASYPGVLSVGALDNDGSLATFSDKRSQVAVTAPGEGVTSDWPSDGGNSFTTQLDGTSFATAFVSGVVALVRSRYPNMSAAAVMARVKKTANGGTGPGTGDGLVNPIQAVTAILPAATPSASPAARPQRVAVYRAPPPDSAVRADALEIVLAGLGGAALVAIGAVVISQGRRRRWRAGRMGIPADREVVDEVWPGG